MQTSSLDHLTLIRRLESTSELSSEDRAVISALPIRLRAVGEKRDIIRDGVRPTESCLILEGIAARYKMLSNGRRQILSFHFPGDLPDLHSLHLRTMDHALFSVTPTRVAFIPHADVRALKRAQPGVGDALDAHSMIDAAIYREWICNLGRRTALERIAHVICECFVRLRAVGLTSQENFELPLTQTEIGDATGLSNVHVNRTMKQLRRLGLIETNAKVHGIVNWEKLQDVGDFDPGYLQLRRVPRA